MGPDLRDHRGTVFGSDRIFATGLGSFLGGYAKNAIDAVLSPLYLYEVFFVVIFCAAIGLLAINRLIIIQAVGGPPVNPGNDGNGEG